MSQFKYRPDVDGLRALSVIAVLLFHARLACPGGFVGVDVFFVISGFLITSLILRDLDAGEFRLMEFWARRVRRILPALTVCLLVTLVAGSLLLLPKDLLELAKSGVAQSLFSANIYFWQTLDYFAGRGQRMPLLHTWSLAVEEQFYFVFPFVAAWFARRNRGRFAMFLSLVAAVSFALSAWGAYAKPVITFYLLPTRAWEMLCGSLVAFLARSRRPGLVVSEALSIAGLSAILWPIFMYDETIPFPGATALPPCLGATALIWANSGHVSAVARLLALRPVVFIGLISYSLYLWHWPIFAFINTCLMEQATTTVRTLAALASVGLGWLSWRFVETPFRRPAPGHTPAQTVKWGLIASAVPLLLWLILVGTNGLEGRLDRNLREYLATSKMSARFRNVELDQVREGRIPATGPQGDPCFLLWGDSHGMQLGDVFDSLSQELQVPGQVLVHQGTAPLLGAARRSRFDDDRALNAAVVEYVAQQKIPHVILAARWSYYYSGGLDGNAEPLVFDDQGQSRDIAEARRAFERSVTRTVAALQKAGARVWVLKQAPEQEMNVAWTIARNRLLGAPSPRGLPRQAYESRVQFCDECFQASGLPTEQYIQFDSDLVDARGDCRVMDDAGVFYFDDNHLSRHGVEQLLRPRLRSLLQEIGTECGAAARTPGNQ